MKHRNLIFLVFLVGVVASIMAATPDASTSYSWVLADNLGLRTPSTIDTLFENYSLRFVPSGQSAAFATTGNYGAEGREMLFSRRQPASDFFFRDEFKWWLPSVGDTKFYNTRIPMTLLSYNFGGGKQDAQERLHGIFSGNINRRAQVGALLDYLYSKGSYANQAAKNLSWGFSGSYMGDRYEFQGLFYHYNTVNKENGGIDDPQWITDPAALQGGVESIDPKSIPTRLSDAHTRLAGQQLFLNNRYKIGYWHEEQANDTTVNRTYIPVTSLIWTLDYRSARHVFDDPSMSEVSDFFANTYLNPELTHDRTSYWALRNTVGISLLEGFHRYARFGLAAYATHEIRRYSQTADTLSYADLADRLSERPAGYELIPGHATQNLLWVGAQLTRQQGSVLNYRASAEFGMIGDAAGEVKLDGDVSTRFPLLGDSARIGAYGRFHNQSAPYLFNYYLSNHFIWHNDFGKQRTVSFGGSIGLDRTYTNVSAGVTNLQNFLYFDNTGLPKQHVSNIQVFSIMLNQDFHIGAFNWENRLYYQTSTDETVLSLPKFAVYSNLYFRFHIATLQVQAGVDCDYYTRYYAPAFQPATASMVNQREVKLGNYPFMNLYFNFKLSRARFYVMMSHINQGLTGRNYFSVVDYPLNPRRFQLGISVDFAN